MDASGASEIKNINNSFVFLFCIVNCDFIKQICAIKTTQQNGLLPAEMTTSAIIAKKSFMDTETKPF